MGCKDFCEQRTNPGSIVLPINPISTPFTNIQIDNDIEIDFNIYQLSDDAPPPIVHVFQAAERTQFVHFPINHNKEKYNTCYTTINPTKNMQQIRRNANRKNYTHNTVSNLLPGMSDGQYVLHTDDLINLHTCDDMISDDEEDL